MQLIERNFMGIGLFSRQTKGFGALLALVSSACAFLPVEEISPHFTEGDATPVFSAGYGYISERFIENVNIGDLTVNGLEGLTAIDPQLDVSRNGDYVNLSLGNSFLGSIPAPSDNDTKAWADLTVEMIENSRIVSTPLLEMQAEDIYSNIFQNMVAELDGFSRYASAIEARRNRA
ncbi:MAG TPA: hypothetical protein DCP05_00645, partial [Rhodospirillaceae bacterium]|nr:hypothetical protein [Rhodospirillaceae bacterium]